MTLGSPSIKNESATLSTAQIEGYLLVGLVGVLSGIAVAYVRMPLHLPGHKAVLWIPPVLAARFATRRQLGGIAGAAVSVVTALLLGGRLAGGVVGMPLVILAGVVLDIAAVHLESRTSQLWRLVLTLGSAGLAANLICFIKRLFEPTGAFFSAANLRDVRWSAANYALLGLAAGVIGAIIVWSISRNRRMQA